MKTLLAISLFTITAAAQCKLPDFSTFDAWIQQQKLVATITSDGTAATGTATIGGTDYTLRGGDAATVLANLASDLAGNGATVAVAGSVLTIKAPQPLGISVPSHLTAVDQVGLFRGATVARDAMLQAAIADCQAAAATLAAAGADTDDAVVGAASKAVRVTYPADARAARWAFYGLVLTFLTPAQLFGFIDTVVGVR